MTYINPSFGNNNYYQKTLKQTNQPQAKTVALSTKNTDDTVSFSKFDNTLLPEKEKETPTTMGKAGALVKIGKVLVKVGKWAWTKIKDAYIKHGAGLVVNASIEGAEYAIDKLSGEKVGKEEGK